MKDNSKALSLPVVVGTGLAAFALSFLWYSALFFGGAWAVLSDPDPGVMPLWKPLVAPLREIVTAYALGLLIVRLRVVTWAGALRLASGLWLAFHAMLIAGAILWDNDPWALVAIHAGDWLMKMLVMAGLLTLSHRRRGGVGAAPA